MVHLEEGVESESLGESRPASRNSARVVVEVLTVRLCRGNCVGQWFSDKRGCVARQRLLRFGCLAVALDDLAQVVERCKGMAAVLQIDGLALTVFPAMYHIKSQSIIRHRLAGKCFNGHVQMQLTLGYRVVESGIRIAENSMQASRRMLLGFIEWHRLGPGAIIVVWILALYITLDWLSYRRVVTGS